MNEIAQSMANVRGLVEGLCANHLVIMLDMLVHNVNTHHSQDERDVWLRRVKIL